MSEAAVVLELAHASLLVVAADLSFVIRVHSTHIMSARVVTWHWLHKIMCKHSDWNADGQDRVVGILITYIVDTSALIVAMGEGAGVSKTASLRLLEVATQRGLVLNVGHLILVASLLIVVRFFVRGQILIGLFSGLFLQVYVI